MYLSSISSSLHLHDTNSWDFKKSYGCCEGLLRDISWSDDSKYLLQVNSRGQVEILTAVDHDVRSLQHIPLNDSWSASFHREGHRNVAIGTKSGNVIIWDTKIKNVTKSFPTPQKQSCVNLLSFNARNTSLAATMQNGETIIYGLVSNIPVLTFRLACSKSITAMKFHHDSRSMLGLATDEGHLILKDIASNKNRCFFENAHSAPVSDFAYSIVNKDVMLSCGFDRFMQVYDVRMQTVVCNIRTTQTLSSLAINAENQVALGTKSGVVVLYDLRNRTTPFKVLEGHEEQVTKVAFQPVPHKKYNLHDVSLRERSGENDITPRTPPSPSKNNTSEIFYITDSPPKNTSHSNNQSKNEDSFLVMMGLDKSNNSFREDMDLDKSKNSFREDNKSTLDRQNKESNNFVPEENMSKVSTEKNTSKVSTPLNTNKTNEAMILPSPIVANGVPDDGRSPNLNNIDSIAVEDLKDCIKSTLADVAYHNRSYFLSVIMEFVKLKLYLEKQMAGLNEQIQMLANNQIALLETNRKLAYDIDVLKAEKHNEFI